MITSLRGRETWECDKINESTPFKLLNACNLAENIAIRKGLAASTAILEKLGHIIPGLHRFYFHFDKGQWVLIVAPLLPVDTRTVRVVPVLAVWAGVVTGFVPPAAVVRLSTVAVELIIVAVNRCEIHSVVVDHCISWSTVSEQKLKVGLYFVFVVTW